MQRRRDRREVVDARLRLPCGEQIEDGRTRGHVGLEVCEDVRGITHGNVTSEGLGPETVEAMNLLVRADASVASDPDPGLITEHCGRIEGTNVLPAGTEPLRRAERAQPAVGTRGTMQRGLDPATDQHRNTPAVAALQTRPFDRVMTLAGQPTMLPEQVEQEIDALVHPRAAFGGPHADHRVLGRIVTTQPDAGDDSRGVNIGEIEELAGHQRRVPQGKDQNTGVELPFDPQTCEVVQGRETVLTPATSEADVVGHHHVVDRTRVDPIDQLDEPWAVEPYYVGSQADTDAKPLSIGQFEHPVTLEDTEPSGSAPVDGPAPGSRLGSDGHLR